MPKDAFSKGPKTTAWGRRAYSWGSNTRPFERFYYFSDIDVVGVERPRGEGSVHAESPGGYRTLTLPEKITAYSC